MKVDVKLDRVTVTGKAYDMVSLLGFARQQGWTIKNSQEQVYAVLERYFDNGDTENVAFLAPNPYQNGSWRVDTSNHLSDDELKRVSCISNRLAGSHLTRIDIAFDFINGFYEPMKHVILRPRATQTAIFETEYRDASRRLQTLYSGRRSSEKMYRLYNKLDEQKRHHIAVPADVERWERWEIQLRGRKTEEWVSSAKEMLNQIRYPMYQDPDLKPADLAILHAIDDGLLSFKDFSKDKAAKLRKKQKKDSNYGNKYSLAAEKVLVENINQINSDVKRFLGRL